MIAQYTTTRHRIGRSRSTRQIWLKAELIVAKSMIEVNARPMMPTPVALPAFSMKLVSAEVTACPACGTRFRKTKD